MQGQQENLVNKRTESCAAGMMIRPPTNKTRGINKEEFVGVGQGLNHAQNLEHL